MIYFLNKDGEVIRQGHVGDTSIQLNFEKLFYVEYVQADSNELSCACVILDRKEPNKLIFTFCGDEARTIAANWG